MNIIQKAFRGFIDGYRLEKKSLGSEYMQVGAGFFPINNQGDYIVNVNQNNAYSKIAVVYKIITTIAERVSDAVFEQEELKEEGKKLKYSDFLNLLKKPNMYQSGSDFLIELASYMMLKGEFFIMKDKTGFTEKTELYCIPPNEVVITESHYIIKNVRIPKTDGIIFHYRDFVPGYRVDSTVRVLSPLEVAASNISTIDFGIGVNQKIMRNGGVPGVAWEDPQAGAIPADPASLKQLKDDLTKRYSSGMTYGEVPVYSYKIGYTSFGLTQSDMKILESVEFSEERIAYIFKFPLFLLSNSKGGGGLNSNERENANKELLVNAVFPKLKRIAEVFTNILDDNRYQICYDKYSYPEMEKDWNTLSQSLDRMWYLTPNQKLETLGFEKSTDPNMDLILVPSTLKPLEEVANGGTSTADILPNNTGDYLN